MAAKSKPNELLITRLYDAPVKMVWEAFTDAKHQAHWWGPRGFTITTKSKDLRPGGKWVYTMHGPDGKDWPNVTLYHEVETCKKLVYDHGGTEDTPPLFRVTVLFAEVKGKTQMEMWMAFNDEVAARESKKFIKQVGGNSTWDRLAEYLDKQQNNKDVFVINRAYEAPIDKVFEMFVNPKHIEKWLPPHGMTMSYFRSDIREGGTCFSKMVSGDGSFTHYQVFEYLKIQKPNLLVYKQSFADEKEKIQPPPFDDNWPASMLARIEFTTEETGDTRVTISWTAEGATKEQIATFMKERASMTQGWNGSLEKLGELLQVNSL